MRVHEFTLLVEGADLQTDEAQDALFEAGCDDSTIGVVAGVQHVHFDREAGSLAEALVSAITAVEQAVPGVRVVRVAPDEYVTLAEIAAGSPDPALSAVNGLLQARAAMARLDTSARDIVLSLQPAVRGQLLELAAAVGAATVKSGVFDAAA